MQSHESTRQEELLSQADMKGFMRDHLSGEARRDVQSAIQNAALALAYARGHKAASPRDIEALQDALDGLCLSAYTIWCVGEALGTQADDLRERARHADGVEEALHGQ
jgi:hypothetical protein